ncbi:MAG: DMT family transporter [Pseudomonadota bacterium]
MTRETWIGLLFMALGMMLLPVGDAIAKHITTITLYSGAFLAWTRFAVGFALVAPYVAARGLHRDLGWDFIRRQAIRGGLVAVAITCMINAVERAPLADVFGAFFVGPSIATILAVLLLGERARWPDWAAVILGFVGVLLVVQPTGEPGAGLFWALGGGCLFGCFLVATRWSTGSAPPIAQLAGQFFFGGLVLAPIAIGDLVTHGLVQPWLILIAAISSGTSNLLQILAFRHAGAVYLAPMIYTQILSATAISVFIFGDRLDPVALLGLVVILSAAAFKIPWNAVRRRST